MKNKILSILSILLVCTQAYAMVNWNIGIGIGNPYPNNLPYPYSYNSGLYIHAQPSPPMHPHMCPAIRREPYFHREPMMADYSRTQNLAHWKH